MTVFKTYFKIVKAYLPIMLTFTIIFTFFAVFTTRNTKPSGNFTSAKSNVMVVNHDDSNMTAHFMKYIQKNAKIVETKKTEEARKDELFFRKIDEIIEIPEGFGEQLLKGEMPKIKTQKVPDSTNGIYTELLFEQYLKTVNIYVKLNMSEKEIIQNIDNTFQKQANVELLKKEQNHIEGTKFFYSFSSYVFLAVLLMIIGMVMSSFKQKQIRNRNYVSAYHYRKMNRELFLGNATFTLAIWILYQIIACVLYPDTMFTMYGVLFMLNSFVFCFVALALAFLIGSFVKNREAQNGIANVVALGSSFICGAFVPQQYLGAQVIQVSKLLPSYWFIKSNELIASLSHFQFSDMLPILQNCLILIGFGLAFFFLTNFVTRILVKRKQA